MSGISKKSFTLDETSIRILLQALENQSKQVQNTLQRPAVPFNNFQPLGATPECYMALSLDAQGIPAISGPNVTAMVPGVGYCGIYEVITGSQTLTYTGQRLPVFNSFTTAVSQGSFFPIIRDKGGNWWVSGSPNPSTSTPQCIITYYEINCNLTSGDTLEVGLTLTIPEDGLYLVWLQMLGQLECTQNINSGSGLPYELPYLELNVDIDTEPGTSGTFLSTIMYALGQSYPFAGTPETLTNLSSEEMFGATVLSLNEGDILRVLGSTGGGSGTVTITSAYVGGITGRGDTTIVGQLGAIQIPNGILSTTTVS